MILTIIAILTLAIVVVTLLPLSHSSHWWVRDLDFPRLQIAFASAVLLAGQWLLLDRSEFPVQLLLAATASCMFYQAWWIIPYTQLYPNEVRLAAGHDPSCRVRILSCNVLRTNRDSDILIALIRKHDPDIVVTLEDVYPYTIKCPLENTYGMHVYSKLLLKNTATQFLVQPGVPSMHAMVVLKSGQGVRMHFLHPAPPSPTENDESTERDAELLVVAKSVAEVGWACHRRRRPERRGLVDDDPPSPKNQRPARPARRPRHVQFLSCRLLVYPVAIGSPLPQPSFHPVIHAASSNLRFRSLSGTGRTGP